MSGVPLSEADVSDAPDLVNVDQLRHLSDGVLVSDEDFLIFQWIVTAVVCQAINGLGIVTNTINIVCFSSQGFKDPVNVSLMGLAISDLCSLVTLMWSCICSTQSINGADVPYDPFGTQYLISGIPHTTFARISGWITALITLERCLCITVPLKVKDIITSRRITLAIVFVFVSHIVSVTPLYLVYRLEMVWIPARNKTIFGLVFKDNRETFEKVCFVVNNGFFAFAAFVVISICTGILVTKLRNKTEWRKQLTSTGQADILSSRNLKVAKMVVTISLLFIICFVPISLSFLAMALVPGLSIDGIHRNILVIIACIGVLLEAINSSVNIFVYYYMSSKYKETFLKLFLLKRN